MVPPPWIPTLGSQFQHKPECLHRLPLEGSIQSNVLAYSGFITVNSSLIELVSILVYGGKGDKRRILVAIGFSVSFTLIHYIHHPKLLKNCANTRVWLHGDWKLLPNIFLENWYNFPGGLVVKNLPSNARGVGLITGQGTKIPHAACCGQEKKIGKTRVFLWEFSFFIFIYLFVFRGSCSMWDLQSSLQHAGSLVVVCDIFLSFLMQGFRYHMWTL